MRLTRHPGRIDIRNVSLLGGFCFFLSALEYLIPKPLPFIRLGLANIPLILALDIMPFSSFVLLGCLKITGQALISGTFFSYVFLFSLGGTGVSALFMYALRRWPGKERISFIGISTAGALASNGVQLVLAFFFVFGKSIIYAAAPILAMGLVTGMLLGIGAEYFVRRSGWYARMEDPSAAGSGFTVGSHSTGSYAAGTDGIGADGIRAAQKALPVKAHEGNSGNFSARFRKARESFCFKNFSSGALAAAGLCMMPALLFNPNTGARIVQFLFFWALAWLSGKKNKPVITVSVMLGIVLFNLLVPYGEVLFSAGPLKITSGALQEGIRRAVTVEGLFMLSRCCVRSDLRLPGIFGEIVGESFRIFSRLAEEKKLFSRTNWVERLDGLLVSYGEESFHQENFPQKSVPPESYPPGGGTAEAVFLLPGRIILLAGIILAWLPLVSALLQKFRVFPRL